MKKNYSLSNRRQKAKLYRSRVRVTRARQMFLCAFILLPTLTTPISHTRIPQGQHQFDDYLHAVVTYLNAIRGADPNPRGQMLGLTVANLTALTSKLTQWYTGNPASPGLWEVHTNVYGPTNTSTTNRDVVDFIKAFRTFFNPMLDTMAANGALDNSDRTVLHIAFPDGTLTDRGRITNPVILNLISLTGGHIKVSTRWTNDSTRPSIDPLADGVEFKYIVLAANAAPPASVNDCPLYKFSKTAVFHLDPMVDKAGMRLWGYARSVNLSNPSNNGDWNVVQGVIIQG